jgi:Zn-dependent protease with chaperone function
MVEWAHRGGTSLGAVVMLPLGGFVPVVGAWLRDEPIGGWGGVVERLGGAWPRPDRDDPDADLGPILARADAPRLFDDLDRLARKLGTRVPREVRLGYLPICAVTSWGRSKVLVVGLPLLDVLTRGELRAVLAHELSHLARGDATHAARRSRFFASLESRLLDPDNVSRFSPLRAWASACSSIGSRLAAPLAREQETRADSDAARLAGGPTAASAVVKVALVQPLFRTLLDHFDSLGPNDGNLYAAFRAFWTSLTPDFLESMRHRMMTHAHEAPVDRAHPPLLDRLAAMQAHPDRRSDADEPDATAVSVLGDPEALETMLHNRLFGTASVEKSVFHRAGR